MKTAKRLLRKTREAGEDQYLSILDVRNTPTQGVGSSPSQRLMNRRTKTLLPTTAELLTPRRVSKEAERKKLWKKKVTQAEYYNRSARDLEALEVGDVVRMKPFRGEKRWRKATVNKRLDERSYQIQDDDNRAIYRRNRVHLRKTGETPRVSVIPHDTPGMTTISMDETQENELPPDIQAVPPSPVHQNKPPMTRSRRIIRRPARYSD